MSDLPKGTIAIEGNEEARQTDEHLEYYQKLVDQQNEGKLFGVFRSYFFRKQLQTCQDTNRDDAMARELICTTAKQDWMQPVVDHLTAKAGDDEEASELHRKWGMQDAESVEAIDEKQELEGKLTQMMQVENNVDLCSKDFREAENELMDKVFELDFEQECDN